VARRLFVVWLNVTLSAEDGILHFAEVASSDDEDCRPVYTTRFYGSEGEARADAKRWLREHEMAEAC